MRIDGARIDKGELILTIPPTERRNVMRFIYSFAPAEYDIVKARKKRSLDANAYAWVLINKIADSVRESPENVYREALKNIPDICEVICVQDKAVDSMRRLWIKDHIGRRVEVMPSKIDGCSTLFVYYGSSDFDIHQMSIFIDNLIQDAKALDIETRPEEEIKSLLEAWND